LNESEAALRLGESLSQVNWTSEGDNFLSKTQASSSEALDKDFGQFDNSPAISFEVFNFQNGQY
jgi:hypothetical protein